MGRLTFRPPRERATGAGPGRGLSRARWLLLAALLFPGCSRPPTLSVGAKNFTEQTLLGEIAAQQVERRLRRPVRRRLNLGSTFIAHLALVNGRIDLYPEYTGTALTAILKRPPDSDRAGVLRDVRAAYRERFRAEWLPPLGFNNTWAMVVRGDAARAGAMRTLSDAAGREAPWRLGVGYEFQSRPDGLPALRSTYGLRTTRLTAMDLGLLYSALTAGQVEMVAANATDGLLATLDVTMLEDDRRAFPPYEAAFVVREDSLREFPGLREALAELSGRLTNDVMRRLNYEVDGRKRPAREVAAEWLRGHVP